MRATYTYLFLIKESLTIAQPITAPETGELIISLLQQGFVVSPMLVRDCANSKQALQFYEKRTHKIAWRWW